MMLRPIICGETLCPEWRLGNLRGRASSHIPRVRFFMSQSFSTAQFHGSWLEIGTPYCNRTPCGVLEVESPCPCVISNWHRFPPDSELAHENRIMNLLEFSTNFLKILVPLDWRQPEGPHVPTFDIRVAVRFNNPELFSN